MRFCLLLFTLVSLLFASSQAQPKVPQWAKDAVWYQIFPERFRNGDPSNDPTTEEMEIKTPRQWNVSPWTSDWYKLQRWEETYNKSFFENVFDRRYGGDLQGVSDKMDYLADLGITAIYFNPIFESYSLHKYDASTYHHIDNNFGPDSKGDLILIADETDNPKTWKWTAADQLFLKVLQEAHKWGIKVIIDGVFNHCGTRFWAFEDVVQRQQQSRYATWFDVKRWDDPSTSQNEFDYKGWWDYKGMPEFREGENGFVKPVWDYFVNVTRRWMDPNNDGNPSDGVDGWRLDVANDVSHVFWREWRTLVKSINPEAYIVGEIWDDASPWLKGDEFDAVMNYPFARAVVRFFIDTSNRKYSVPDFDKELATVRASYPDEVNYVLQNLIDSHDTDRLVSMIANPNRNYDAENGLRQNKNYNIAKPDEQARAIQKLILLFQMTYLGAPMIYYGDEAGMWGADDPDDRKPMVWSDLAYDNEQSHPISDKTRSDDVVKFNQNLFEYYKQLVRVRNENVALRRGDFKTLLMDNQKELYAFVRQSGDNTVIVVVNNSYESRTASIAVGGRFREQLSGNVFDAKTNLELSVGSKAGMILVKE